MFCEHLNDSKEGRGWEEGHYNSESNSAILDFPRV